VIAISRARGADGISHVGGRKAVGRARPDRAVRLASRAYRLDNDYPSTAQGLEALRTRPTGEPEARTGCPTSRRRAGSIFWRPDNLLRVSGHVNPQGYDLLSYGPRRAAGGHERGRGHHVVGEFAGRKTVTRRACRSRSAAQSRGLACTAESAGGTARLRAMPSRGFQPSILAAMTPFTTVRPYLTVAHCRGDRRRRDRQPSELGGHRPRLVPTSGHGGGDTRRGSPLRPPTRPPIVFQRSRRSLGGVPLERAVRRAKRSRAGRCANVADARARLHEGEGFAQALGAARGVCRDRPSHGARG